MTTSECSVSTHQVVGTSGAAMDLDSQAPGEKQTPPAGGAALRRTLLLLSITLMVLGGAGGPLFIRIYFLHGGARLWLTSLLQTCGFPIVVPPLLAFYLRRRGRKVGGISSMTGGTAAACVGIGIISGLCSYMYAYGSASLPLSTSTLLMSTQLAFTAAFAFLIVRQKFTAYSVNAVVLLLMGPVVLGQQAGGDRPAGESNRRYHIGFFMMLGAAVLLGLQTPLIELTYLKMKRKVTYILVTEMQVVMAVSTSAFCVGAMLVNKDFQAIPREAKEYGLGETKYYLVLSAAAIFWQLMSLGFVGVITCSSSLLAGIVIATLLPLGEILPVIALHEKFSGGKGVAMALSMWGFASYLYGEYKQHRKQKQAADDGLELPLAP